MNIHSSPKNVLKPRRTLNRLAAAFFALGIGGLAQAAFRRGGVWDGVLLYAVAAFLFVSAVGRDKRKTSALSSYRGLFAALGLSAGRQLQAGIWFLIIAVAASFAGWFLFDDADRLVMAWWLYGLSLAMFIAGTLLLTRGQGDKGTGRQRDKGILRRKVSVSPPPLVSVSLIILLALALRLWSFNHLPFGVWYDEAEAGLQARRWLSEGNFKPAFYAPISVSGQLLFLYSAALRFISDSVQGLRLVSVLFGVGGVLAAYLFGRELVKGRGGDKERGRGRKTSPPHPLTPLPLLPLSLAFFVAVMRWDINFSRIAMTGIDTPFFEFMTLFFLTRLLRRGRLRDAAFAGLTLGMGLNFYTAFRLFILAVGIFFLLGVIIWPHWWGRRADWKWWGQLVVRGLMLGLAAWIAIMPSAQFAVRHPEAYWLRINMTSITTRRDDPNLGRALQTSLAKHLAMFHLAGDKNGRHNLPGEPMLDPAMGVLMMLGLGLALANARKPANLFFLILLPVSLLGGILSLDFEAPQSLRSIAAIPAVVYFCALPVIALLQEIRRAFLPSPVLTKLPLVTVGNQQHRLFPVQSARNGRLLLPLILTGLYILGLNVHTYFVRQANDFAVWNAFSTSETLTGRKMAQLGPDYDFYLSPFLTNHPAIRFISPAETRNITLSLPNALPIRSDAMRAAAMFIHPDDGWVFEEAMRLYPAGSFESVSNKPENPPSVHIAILSPNDIASVQGLALSYWAGSEIRLGQIPMRGLRVENIDVDWSATTPLEPPFIAEWAGILYAEQYGLYQLLLNAPGKAVLEIDGVEVLSGSGEQKVNWELAEGNHTLRLQVNAQTNQGRVQLRWQPPGKPQAIIPSNAFYQNPVTNNGLLGKYYAKPNWNGSPTFTRIDPFLDTYFHFTSLPRPYSVAWTGQLEIPATGIYGFGLRAVSDAQLFIDNTLIVDTQAPNQYSESGASLQAGLHTIAVRFVDDQPRSRIHLYWTPPGADAPEPIPSQNLWPPMGDAWQPSVQVVPPTPDFVALPVSLTHRATLAEGLIEPRDIAVGPQGNVYIADVGIKGVAVFTEGKLIDIWTETSAGAFEEPLALVAATDASIWVLDSTRQWVYKFGPTGKPLDKVGGPDAMLYHPRGLALLDPSGSNGVLAIVNTGAGRLTLYALDGVPLGSVSVFGDAPGQLNEPVDALQGEFGAYFITEGANVRRWQRLDPFGKSLAVWPFDAPAAFDGSHLAWGPDGSIFMTNSQAGVVRRYSPNGDLLDEWHNIGPVTFERPVGIFVSSSRGQLFVSDVGTGEVYVFEIAMATDR